MQVEIKRKLEQQYSYQKKKDFKIKTATKEKEGHCITIKESIQEKDITIVIKYAPNIGAPQYIRQMLTAIKGKLTVTQ